MFLVSSCAPVAGGSLGRLGRDSWLVSGDPRPRGDVLSLSPSRASGPAGAGAVDVVVPTPVSGSVVAPTLL